MAQEAKSTNTHAKPLSAARLCAIFAISPKCWRYQRKTTVTNELISQALLQLAAKHNTWGFGLMFLHLRNQQGKPWNHKRVYRIYCELRLNLRINPNFPLE